MKLQFVLNPEKQNHLELHNWLNEIARKEDRSISSIVVMMLKSAFEQRKVSDNGKDVPNKSTRSKA